MKYLKEDNKMTALIIVGIVLFNLLFLVFNYGAHKNDPYK